MVSHTPNRRYSLNLTLSSTSLFPPHPPSHSFLPAHHTSFLFHSHLTPYSVKSLPKEQAIASGHRYRRDSNILSDVLHREARTNLSLSNIKVHSDTEGELDALERMIRPRRLRCSIAALPALPLPEDNVKPKNRGVMLEMEMDTSEEKKKKAPFHPKKFINLQKLPFGQHSSYNKETDIREKIVSQRWKAWKRQQHTKSMPKRSF